MPDPVIIRSVVTAAAPQVIRSVVSPAAPQVISRTVPGPRGLQGEPGPDAWDIDVDPNTVSGAVTLTYSNGAYFRLTITGDIQLSVTGWPAADKVSRLTVEAHTSGAFDVTEWPAGTVFPYAVPLNLTANGITRFVLSTSDGGSTVFCDPVGQAYGA